MKRRVFCATVLLLTAAATCWASRVTVDPNTAEPQATNAAAVADQRLERKVTYNGGYRRLHTVADQLTSLTGVRIYVGANTRDWRIRDIPLVVCAKDLPLGTLLKAIAESTHTTLTSELLESGPSKGQRVYRFYRTKRAQNAIDGRLDDARLRQFALIDWAWDGLARLGAMPRPRQERIAAEMKGGDLVLPFAHVLSALGPGAKDRLLAGETLTLNASGQYRAALQEMCLAYWQARSESFAKSGRTVDKPGEEELNALTLTLKLRDGGSSGFSDIWAHLASSDPNNAKFTSAYPCMSSAGLWAPKLEESKELNLPPRPKGEEVAGPEADRPADPELRAIRTEQDWTSPLLTQKTRLARPADRETLVFSVMLAALADSANINIVAEDFLSHTWGSEDDYKDLFDRETSPSALLRKTSCTWFVSEKNRLLVGWAQSGGRWRRYHANLVPERLITGLTGKLDKGVELDDVTPIVGLTPEQRNDWISNNRDTLWLVGVLQSGQSLWRVYDSLSPGDKALARSEPGLPLAKLDLEALSSLIRQQDYLSRAASFPKEDDGHDRITPGPLLDPKVLATAVMRIRQSPATKPARADMLRAGPGPAAFWHPRLHHTYALEVEYEHDGARTTYRAPDIGLSFPVYSDKREKELAK